MELGLDGVASVGLAPGGLGVNVAGWLVGLGVFEGSAVDAGTGLTSR